MAWAGYLRFMQRSPYLASLCTAGGVGLIGDVTAQTITTYRSSTNIQTTPQIPEIDGAQIDTQSNVSLNYDVERMGKVVLYQSMTAIPMYLYFNWLEGFWPKVVAPASRFAHIASKVIFHQCLFATTINATFFGWVIAWDAFKNDNKPRKILSVWRKKLVTDLPMTMAMSWCFWGPWNTINFVAVPLRAKVAFASTGSAMWMVYLSIVGHRKSQLETKRATIGVLTTASPPKLSST